MSISRKEQLEKVEHFASLWDRLVNLYLNREKFEDIDATKENDFLSLQGAIMQELGGLTDIEEGRFSLVEEVSSVINEAISLRHLRDHSDFQIRRRKERGRQVADLIGKFKSFVAERDKSTRRTEKELEEKLARPFWDPEQGKFGFILGRVVASPVRFFSALRIAGEAKKANTFLLTVLSLLSLGCVISAAACNASAVRTMAYNFALETGILSSEVGAGAKIIIWLLAGVGVITISLAGALLAAILAHALAFLMHGGFKIVGGLGDMVATHKVVAFGLAPLLLLIVPWVVYSAGGADASSAIPSTLAAAAVAYIAVLHIVGFNKVHNRPVLAGVFGWLIGVVLFAGVVLAALWIWHASAGTLPPSSGKYVYVTATEASMRLGNRVIPGRGFGKGEILDFVEEQEDFYVVPHGKSDVRIRKSDAELREGSLLSLPNFLVEHSLARAEVLVDRLSRKIKQ